MKHYDLASLITEAPLTTTPRGQLVAALRQAAQQLNAALDAALGAGISIAADIQEGALYPVDSEVILRPTMHVLVTAH